MSYCATWKSCVLLIFVRPYREPHPTLAHSVHPPLSKELFGRVGRDGAARVAVAVHLVRCIERQHSVACEGERAAELLIGDVNVPFSPIDPDFVRWVSIERMAQRLGV